MTRRRPRWIEMLTRTLLRLLAVAGLFAMLPSLPEPRSDRALARPALAAPRADVERADGRARRVVVARASAEAVERADRGPLGALSRPAASGLRLR